MLAKFIRISLLICLTILINGCKQTIEFQKTKEGEIASLDSRLSIESYSMRFNPKSYGVIIIRFNNGDEYTAAELTSSQLVSLLHILEESNLEYDDQNAEFIINR